MVQRLQAHGIDATDVSAEATEVPRYLLLMVTSDRGLCGAFNANLVRETRVLLRQWRAANVSFGLACIGRRGRDLLRREFVENMHYELTDLSRIHLHWDHGRRVGLDLHSLMENHGYTHLIAVYSRFQSAMSQQVTRQQLIPYESIHLEEESPFYYDILEPTGPELLQSLLSDNLTAQIYRILLESSASEHGARMTAMDSATRNAQEVIRTLQLSYNRTRQALITKELIEVISGAEAL